MSISLNVAVAWRWNGGGGEAAGSVEMWGLLRVGLYQVLHDSKAAVNKSLDEEKRRQDISARNGGKLERVERVTAMTTLDSGAAVRSDEPAPSFGETNHNRATITLHIV